MAMVECPPGAAIAGNHPSPLPITASCPTGDNISSTATLGTSVLGPPSTPRIGHFRVIVCDAAATPGCVAVGAFPDIRLFGNYSDVVCKGTAPVAICPGGPGSDYDPNAAAPFYGAGLVPGTNSNTTPPTPLCGGGGIPVCGAGADMTATATIPGSASPGLGPPPLGPAIRITDHFNGVPAAGNGTPTPPEPGACAGTTTCTGTVVDNPIAIPVVCAPNAAPIGSYCGANTTINALFGAGTVGAGGLATVRIGEIELYDAGPNGVPVILGGGPDDQLFAVQGVTVP
jgi:hypothetical protein